MKLSELAKKPELTLIVINDEDTIKEFGEPIEFYTFDRIPLDTFSTLASADQSNPKELIDVVKTLILSETGEQIINEKQMLPPVILIRAIGKIVEKLGKL